MRWSGTFIPTLRDNPADAEHPSQRLLIRGGFIRQLSPGIYTYLPLGQRTIRKIALILRQEMEEVGAQEFSLPVTHMAGRLQEEVLRDTPGNASPSRLSGRDLCLGMSHEEMFTDLARRELRSYRDLPQIWYRIQRKFRGEAHPGSGLFRSRQFISMDSCSFDAGVEGLGRSYQLAYEAFCRIFSRCGLKFVVIENGPGSPEESRSQMFLVCTEAGEHVLAACTCGYVSALERAVSRIDKISDPPAQGGIREVHTPGRKTIAEISDFLKVPPVRQIKSMVFVVRGRPHLFLLRGDHQLSAAKVSAAMGTPQVRPADAGEIQAAFGADAGSLGPVGAAGIPVHADLALEDRSNLTCGANKNDYHLQGVTPGVDFQPIWADLRTIERGEGCIRCGLPLELVRAAELGHIAGLGTEYSRARGVLVLGADGRQVPIALGSYSVAAESILSSAIELNHDVDGIIWPIPIAPFSVIVTPVNYRDETRVVADRLYDALGAAGIDTLLDDREERPGIKFKDADLIGVPFRIVVGRERIKEGKVELFSRSTRKTTLLEIQSAAAHLRDLLAEGYNRRAAPDVPGLR